MLTMENYPCFIGEGNSQTLGTIMVTFCCGKSEGSGVTVWVGTRGIIVQGELNGTKRIQVKSLTGLSSIIDFCHLLDFGLGLEELTFMNLSLYHH